MKQSDKKTKRRDARIADWEAMPSIGMIGRDTKLVRNPSGLGHSAFHKPGSSKR